MNLNQEAIGPISQAVEPPGLPELNEAILDEATLELLFRDVEQGTELLEVMCKGDPRQRASERPVGLREALELLRSGAVRGIQLRYRYDGTEWWDTLLKTHEGVRLVRIRHLSRC